MNLRQLNRILLQTSLLPVIALLAISGVLVWQILAAERTVNQIQLADRNIASTSLIDAYLDDEESGLRAYQTTGNQIFLQSYDFASTPLNESFGELRAGIRSQGADERPVDDLISAHRHWQSTIAVPLIIAVRTGGDTSGTGLNLRGKAQMEAMQRTLRAIGADQRKRRMADVENWQGLVKHTLEAVIGLAIVIGLLLGTFIRSRFHLILGAFQNTLADLRRNIRATEASETRLRATLASIGDGVVVCDDRGRIELLNPVAEQLTGWTQHDAFHQPVDNVVQLATPDTRDPIALGALVPATAVLPASPLSSALLLRPDHNATHVDVRGAPILDRRGQTTGSVAVVRDVTEQRRTQSALLVSEKQATAGRVAAMVAHEIHNPLDAVVNLLYLLESGVAPEEGAQFVALARSELDRLSQISRAMLGMYRESTVPIRLDLRELLESVVLLMNHQLLYAGVTLDVSFEGDLAVTGYPVELRQVFTNLLGNAAEASPQGCVIHLKVREKPAGGPASQPGVEILVQDCGAGIEDAAAPHLFEAFFTTKGEKGTGLGLWISHNIVVKHGGSITFSSDTGAETHGTTFTVFLPREAPQSPVLFATEPLSVPVAAGAPGAPTA